MADDELERRLRAHAARLDEGSRPVDVDAVLRAQAADRRRRLRSRPLAFAAVAAAAAVAAGVMSVAMLDDDAGVEVGVTGTSPPSTATPPARTSLDALPVAGIAVTDGEAITLLAFDGTELATVTSAVAGEIGSGPGRRTLALLPGDVLELVDPDPAEAPGGCDEAAGAGGLRVALCGGAEQDRRRVVVVSPTGSTRELVGEAPAAGGIGHWRWALPSPDGRWVLGQWSGECEVPAALLISAADGRVRSVGDAGDGGDEGGGPAESTGLGWAPDGRAVVQFGRGLCGSGTDDPGIYLVDPGTGAREPLRTGDDATGPATLWHRRPHGNEAEAVLSRALGELGLEGCCGEPSHGGPDVTSGARWQGFDVPVAAVPSGDPPHIPFIDHVIEAGPADVDGVEVTVGEADLGPFVAFTCGGRTWSAGGAGSGDRASPAAVRELVRALLPHLYCTTGPRPVATHDGEA